jgi:dipeptidase D
MALELSDSAGVGQAWTSDTGVYVLHVLETLPHGVLAMSMDIPGLVETSNNVATVTLKDGKLVIGNSSRSSVMPALRAVQRRLKAIAQLADAEAVERNGYPGWKPDMASPLLGVVREVYTQVHGREPRSAWCTRASSAASSGEGAGMDMTPSDRRSSSSHSPAERVRVIGGDVLGAARQTLQRLA